VPVYVYITSRLLHSIDFIDDLEANVLAGATSFLLKYTCSLFRRMEPPLSPPPPILIHIFRANVALVLCKLNTDCGLCKEQDITLSILLVRKPSIFFHMNMTLDFVSLHGIAQSVERMVTGWMADGLELTILVQTGPRGMVAPSAGVNGRGVRLTTHL
jgi:hypothetical protein